MAGFVAVGGDTVGAVILTLRPPGAVTGRLKGADEKPLTGTMVYLWAEDGAADRTTDPASRARNPVTTDAPGRSRSARSSPA